MESTFRHHLLTEIADLERYLELYNAGAIRSPLLGGFEVHGQAKLFARQLDSLKTVLADL